MSWGKEWETSFDLAIFIHLDNNERIKRLEKREAKRYGNKLLTDKVLQRNSKAFLEWAKQYENPNFRSRPLTVHNNWIEMFNCEVLRLDGEMKNRNNTNKTVNASPNVCDYLQTLPSF